MEEEEEEVEDAPILPSFLNCWNYDINLYILKLLLSCNKKKTNIKLIKITLDIANLFDLRNVFKKPHILS